MADPKRVVDNPTIPAIAGGDVLFIYDFSTGGDCKVYANDFKLYVLSGAVIGGTANADIMTIAGIQVAYNKTFTNAILNGTITIGTTPLTATGAELNALHGYTGSAANLELCKTYAAEIARLVGLTSPVQVQLDAIAASVADVALSKIYGYTKEIFGATSFTVTRAELLAGAGVSTVYRIIPSSVIECIAEKTGHSYARISGAGGGGPQATWTETNVNGIYNISDITWTGLDAGKYYSISVSFQVDELVAET